MGKGQGLSIKIILSTRMIGSVLIIVLLFPFTGAHEEIDYSAKLKFSDDEGDEEGEEETNESSSDSR